MPDLTPAQLALVDSILSDLDLGETTDAAECRARVREASGGDEAVVQEVLSLLAHYGRTTSDAFMEDPVEVPEGAADGLPPTVVGGRGAKYPKIAGFTIKGVIESGGMGTVYRAQQAKPRRVVALKVMKAGVISPAMRRRFEFEAQTLARLKHPNIAAIYEAGTYTPEGHDEAVPYFAMEYVANARTLVAHANERKLSVRERLELFAIVCEAVHHGHQKGIIHRDLKPTNILVESSGRPKIIDFGIARATDSDMAVTTLQTDVGQIIGTLQYMSPEQCDADPHDLDTRADVYALGVILYELLCCQLPYDIGAAALYEAVRVIREDEPAKPSTVNRVLRGDVETITLKAMEKDRSRRYQSAADLEQDIGRYLRSEPIQARRASVAYQLRRFAQRHRVVVTASLLVVMALAAAAVSSTVFAMQARQEAVRSEERRQAAEWSRDIETLRAERLGTSGDAVRHIVLELRHRVASGGGDDSLHAMYSVIESAIVRPDKIARAILLDPDLREDAALRENAAEFMAQLMESEPGAAEYYGELAATLLKEAIAIRMAAHGSVGLETIESRLLLCYALAVAADRPAARQHARELLAEIPNGSIAEELHRAKVSVVLAELRVRDGDLHEVEDLLDFAATTQSRLFGSLPEATRRAITEFAGLLESEGRAQDSDRWHALLRARH